jgi:shikimate dehydrogenase
MAISNLFGLIGYPLGHSFSKGYFTQKFEEMGISTSHAYELFPIPQIEDLPQIIADNKGVLKGLNVTIPYKQQVISYLDSIDPAAERIGAVNTIKFLPDGTCRGFNTDYYGFQTTLKNWSGFESFSTFKALVLGQGGAAKAVIAAIEDLNIPVIKVSRNASEGIVSYAELPEVMAEVALIVNTTPLGMHPKEDTFPEIPYDLLTQQHYLYDIVYNPLQTTFLKKGIEHRVGGVHEGLEMLYGQADKAWEIWNT